MEEARNYVAEGLQQRKAAWMTREQLLDSYEEEMISCCNQKRENIKAEEEAEYLRLEERMRRRELARAKNQRIREQMEKEEAAMHTVKTFCGVCLGIMMVTTWTAIEWWAAAALVAGLTVFPVAKIFRIYNPIQKEEENDRNKS